MAFQACSQVSLTHSSASSRLFRMRSATQKQSRPYFASVSVSAAVCRSRYRFRIASSSIGILHRVEERSHPYRRRKREKVSAFGEKTAAGNPGSRKRPCNGFGKLIRRSDSCFERRDCARYRTARRAISAWREWPNAGPPACRFHRDPSGKSHPKNGGRA